VFSSSWLHFKITTLENFSWTNFSTAKPIATVSFFPVTVRFDFHLIESNQVLFYLNVKIFRKFERAIGFSFHLLCFNSIRFSQPVPCGPFSGPQDVFWERKGHEHRLLLTQGQNMFKNALILLKNCKNRPALGPPPRPPIPGGWKIRYLHSPLPPEAAGGL